MFLPFSDWNVADIKKVSKINTHVSVLFCLSTVFIIHLLNDFVEEVTFFMQEMDQLS